MTRIFKQLMLAIATGSVVTLAGAQITFYEGEGFRGRTFFADRVVPNFANTGFNDRASSVIVERGLWEVCENSNFRGQCVVLRRGNYDSLERLGMNNRISSVRPIERSRNYERFPDPTPQPAYEYRRRPSERLFEARVTSVRTVYRQSERRCWNEYQAPSNGSSQPNVGGAIVGALIGGIIGHQVGGGRGKDAATAAGAVAGAAIGSGAGADRNTFLNNEVRRCENVSSDRPEYYDVTYEFRGRDYHVQMSSPPGRTITVNDQGVPRS